MSTEQLEQFLSELPTEELQEFWELTEALERSLNLAGPQTDDELHAWILENLGYDVPRVAVCKGHVAPFKFLSDLYFERVLSAVALANRGGSKSFIAAMLHFLNAKFKPNSESASVGAIESQALRVYNHMKGLWKLDGKVDDMDKHPEVKTANMRETVYRNGSKTEVLVGTISGVNGPHPQKVHADEVELMDPVVFDESRNMSQSKGLTKAQDWITSTRKRAHGPMQAILDEIHDAEAKGLDPPYDLYTWCLFETAAPVPTCGTTCGCERVVKGKWENGSQRNFKQVCKGRLKHSQGWVPLHDIHKTFRTVSKPVWEAQQECMKPSTEGLVFATLEARSVHGIRNWVPDPALGPIVRAIDFGGTNPAAVNWYQLLRVPVMWWSPDQDLGEEPQKLLPVRTRIVFDEIYIADAGNKELHRRIIRKDRAWVRALKMAGVATPWRIVATFADPQGKSARIDLAQYDPPVRTQWYCTRDVKEQIKTCNELIDDDLVQVDVTRCPMFIEESESYHYPDKRAGMVDDPEIPVDDFNHCMSEFRYAMENLKVLERKWGRGKSGPKADDRRHQTAGTPGLPRASRDRHVTAGGRR